MISVAKDNFLPLSPEEYLVWIDLYHKNDAGEWIILNDQAGDIIELKSINLSFPIEQVYRHLILTPES